MERELRKVRVPGAEPAEIEKYKIEADCENCDWSGEVELPKGTPAKKGAPLECLAACPNCSCYTLVRRAVKQPAVALPVVGVPEEIVERFRRLVREQPPIIPEPHSPYTPTVTPGPYIVPQWQPPPSYTIWSSALPHNSSGTQFWQIK